MLWRDLMLKAKSLLSAKKAGADVRSLLFLVLFLLGVVYLWFKVAAKRRESEARMRQRRANYSRNQPQGAGGVQRREGSGQRHDAVAKADANTRYLSDRRWMNQCVVFALATVVEMDKATRSLSWKCPIELLQQFAAKHRFYLITDLTHWCQFDVAAIDSDSTKQQLDAFEKIVIALTNTSGLTAAGLPNHRLLFCTTKKGKSAMVRQLNPTLYVDKDVEVLKSLQPHLTEVVQITRDVALGGVHPTVKVSLSVASYFRPPKRLLSS